MMSRTIGGQAEQEARDYLVKNGLIWVTGNYQCRWGEIDLIMRDKEHLVFVEVRARVSDAFGGATGSITPQKQKKIIKTAMHYMMTKKLFDRCAGRFDVVCLQGASSRIEWIKNAFGIDY